MANEMVIGGLTVTITRPTNKQGTGLAVDTGGIDAGSGCSLTPSYETYSPDIEQELFPSLVRYIKKDFKIAFTYAQALLRNMQNGWDISNAISGSPAILDFGTAAAGDFIPADLVVAITGYSPGATTSSSLRTITFGKVNLDSPGEMKITKKGITTVAATYKGLNDGTKVGRFSDVTA